MEETTTTTKATATENTNELSRGTWIGGRVPTDDCHRDRQLATLAGIAAHLLGRGMVVICNYDSHASAREPMRDGPADAVTASGDQGD